MRSFFTHTDPVVPAYHPRVLVETAVAQGADRNALFVGSRLRPEMLDLPETRISYEDFGILVRNALRLTGNPALGLDAGQRTYISSMGLLGLAVMSSPNAGEALSMLLRNGQSLFPALQLSLHLEDGKALMRMRPTIHLPYLEFTTEMVLSAFDSQSRFMLGRPPPLLSARFAYPETPHCRKFIEERYDIPVQFDAEVSEIGFDPQVLSWPTVFAEPSTAQLAERMHVQYAGTGMTRDGIVGQVQHLLDANAGPPPELETVARKLQTSTRTLRRSLRAMGTSFRQLRDAALRTRAEEWATNTDMPFEEMAERLGFSDVRSFRRAFKRWTGQLPSVMRNTARRSSARAEP